MKNTIAPTVAFSNTTDDFFITFTFDCSMQDQFVSDSSGLLNVKQIKFLKQVLRDFLASHNNIEMEKKLFQFLFNPRFFTYEIELASILRFSLKFRRGVKVQICPQLLAFLLSFISLQQSNLFLQQLSFFSTKAAFNKKENLSDAEFLAAVKQQCEQCFTAEHNSMSCFASLFAFQKTAVQWLQLAFQNNLHLLSMFPHFADCTSSAFIYDGSQHRGTIVPIHSIAPVYCLMMPTGSGKTVVTLRTMQPSQTWLVIVPTTLVGQWVSSCCQWRQGCSKQDHVAFRASMSLPSLLEKKTIVVSWAMVKYLPSSLSLYGIIVDEAHFLKITSTKWAQLKRLFPTKHSFQSCPKLVLLSATLSQSTVCHATRYLFNRNDLDFRKHCFAQHVAPRPYQIQHKEHVIPLTSSVETELNYIAKCLNLFSSMSALQVIVECCRKITSGVEFNLIETLKRHVAIIQQKQPLLHALAQQEDPRNALSMPKQLFVQNPCALCYDSLEVPRGLKRCGHVFCCRCLELMFDACYPRQPSCPMCQCRLLFSFSYETVDLHQSTTPDVVLQQPSDDAQQTIQTGKMAWLAQFIQTIDVSNTKVVLVTDFPEVLPMVERFLRRHEWTCFTIQTTQSQEQRTRLLNTFSTFQKGAFLIGRRSVIGQGLNLTAATHLISWEPEYEKADQVQCEGRLDRIGQTADITIHRLVTEQSIEPWMKKWAIAQHCHTQYFKPVTKITTLHRMVSNFVQGQSVDQFVALGVED